MSISNFILGVTLRFLILTWLYIFVALFSYILIPESGITAENFYIIGLVILFPAIIMTFLKYDQQILGRIIAIKDARRVIAAALILVWIIIFYNWFKSIDGFQDVESFLRNGIILFVLGFPSSIIAVTLDFVLSPILEMLYQILDTGSTIETMRKEVIVKWLIYFVPFLIQLHLLGRYLNGKRLFSARKMDERKRNS